MRLVRPAAAVLAAFLVLPFIPASAGERFEDVVQFGTEPGAERVMDLVLDGEGNAYVAGRTHGAFPGFENEWEGDGFIAKVAPSGEVLWADQFGGHDNGENFAWAIALDGAGGVYVTGATQQDMHAALEGYSDPFIRKYSADGTLLWGDQWHGSGDVNWMEWGTGIAVSGSTVYVTGSTDGRGFLRTYGLGGNLLWSAPQADVELHDVAADGADVYLAGVRFDTAAQWEGKRSGFVRRLTPTGATEVPFGGNGDTVELALSDAAVAVAGSAWGEEAHSLVTVWDRTLEERWTWTGALVPHEGLAVTDAGDVFVGGIADWESGDGVVRKLRAMDGSEAWGARVDGAGFGVGGIVATGEQIVFAGASSTELAPGGIGAYVATWTTMRTVPLSRLAGPDRGSTAVAISQEAFPAGASGVVLVSAGRFPDAVVAAPLAAMVGGPVLLAGDELSAAVRAELSRLLEPGGAVTIVGGTSAVSMLVEEQVQSLGFTVTRIAGPTRYDTAVEVAGELGSPPAMVADGSTFPDALVAGTAAIRTGQAVLLSDGEALPAVTRRYLLDAGSGHVAIGGPAATAAPGAEAVVGADRYDTAARVLERFFGAHHVVGLATGSHFADALALAPLLGREGAPLLLTPPDRLAEEIAGSIGLHLLEVYMAGGTAAVAPMVEQQLQPLLTEGG